MNKPLDSGADGKPANSPGKTPNADMQPEDAGTSDSAPAGQAEQARAAMKQTSKTESEAKSDPK